MVGSGILEGVDNSVCSDLFMEHRDFFDFPMESLEGDGMDEGDWDMKLQALGPIPLEALLGSSLASGGNIGKAASDVVPNLSVPSEDSSELKLMPNFVEEASSANIPFQNDYSNGVGSGVFQAPSPVSVLESSSSCSVDRSLSRSNTLVPGRSRTKRSRRPSTINPWLMMMTPIISTSKRSRHFAPYEALSRSNDFSEFNLPMANPVKRKVKKKKKLSQLSGADEEGNSSQRSIAAKRCSHCKVTKTPQWREGPMGPKTLCNACGVRYRSGRLFPEYRPAASPTFVLSLHSNSHRKVIEMRNKATQVAASPHKGFQEAAIAETRPPMSPPPEFIPMTGYLYDCILGSSGSTPIMEVLPK